VTDTYPTPPHGWVCFHCGEHFPATIQGQRAAQLHFGPTPAFEPGCVLKLTSEDRSLLKKLRSAEADLDRYYAEDSEKDRELRRMAADHQVALRRAEEQGYARGIKDSEDKEYERSMRRFAQS
jgi:hypothetical protein